MLGDLQGLGAGGEKIYNRDKLKKSDGKEEWMSRKDISKGNVGACT